MLLILMEDRGGDWIPILPKVSDRSSSSIPKRINRVGCISIVLLIVEFSTLSTLKSFCAVDSDFVDEETSLLKRSNILSENFFKSRCSAADFDVFDVF